MPADDLALLGARSLAATVMNKLGPHVCLAIQGLADLPPPPPPPPPPPQWCIYASENWVSIGTVNGLSPILHQAITWTNADLLSISLRKQTSVKFESNYKTFHSQKCI